VSIPHPTLRPFIHCLFPYTTRVFCKTPFHFQDPIYFLLLQPLLLLASHQATFWSQSDFAFPHYAAYYSVPSCDIQCPLIVCVAHFLDHSISHFRSTSAPPIDVPCGVLSPVDPYVSTYTPTRKFFSAPFHKSYFGEVSPITDLWLSPLLLNDLPFPLPLPVVAFQHGNVKSCTPTPDPSPKFVSLRLGTPLFNRPIPPPGIHPFGLSGPTHITLGHFSRASNPSTIFFPMHVLTTSPL